MRADVARAFAINPFDTIFLLVAVPVGAALWVANRTGGLAVRVSMSRTERNCAWALLAIAAVSNWAYVLMTQR